MSLATLPDLPPELFSHIISFIPVEQCQSAVLALTRACPVAPIPLHHLFENARIIKPNQAISLYQKIRKTSADVNGPRIWIRNISIESFEVDADVCINILRMLLNIQRITLHIGPRNFSPEHLHELISQRPILGLKYLALRFKPYLQKVNHYQFLKGSYFDSALKALAQWPKGSLPVLSIVQDPLDPLVAPRHFAQPMVFFQLDPFLSTLVRSDAAANMTSFRLRIPARPVARSLINGPALGPAAATVLTFLDLSTSNVLENEVDLLLVAFHNVQHLVLDSCAILKGELREGEWAVLGKKCALVGVKRAKEKEKSIKTMLELEYAQSPGSVLSYSHISKDTAPRAQIQQPRVKKAGRRGVASATISLRQRAEATGSRANTQGLIPANIPPGAIPKIRVLPPAPTLKTFCTTTTPNASSLLHLHTPAEDGTANPDTLARHAEIKHAFIKAEFEKGWEEGLSQLRKHCLRLKDSWRNGSARVVRFCDEEEEENHEDEPLYGLCDIEAQGKEQDVFTRIEGGTGGVLASPVLCLAGQDRTATHAVGCGHEIGRNIFSDID